MAKATNKQSKGRADNTKHLIPFKPGQSGNPKGAKKGPTLARFIREQGDEQLPNGMSYAEAFSKLCWTRALKGDYQFAKLIADRLAPIDFKLDITTQVIPAEIHSLTDRLTMMIENKGDD